MRLLMILAGLGISVLLSPLASAQDVLIVKGKQFVTVMTSKVELGGTSTNSTMTFETTITGISDTSITYDQHVTGKGSAGAVTYDLPPQDQKNQSFVRTPKAATPPSTGDGSNPEETELEVNTAVFKGKIRVIHSKTESIEIWSSKEPFEALISLSGDKTIKLKCNYVRTSNTKGNKTDAEVLTLDDFAIVSVFMHVTTSGDGLKSETTTLLRELH
jgi:hypothetical protein